MSKEQTDLLPCPFCGTVEHLRVNAVGSLVAGMPDRPYAVDCHHLDCEEVRGPVGYGKAKAIAAWNRRASPSPAGGVQAADVGETNRSIIHELAADIRDRLSGEEGSAMWRNAQRIVELSRPQPLTSALSSQAQTTGGVE
jgi:hypothetical protein